MAFPDEAISMFLQGSNPKRAQVPSVTSKRPTGSRSLQCAVGLEF